MCFMAGANAIFTGGRMLTTETNEWNEDAAMFNRWGLKGLESFEYQKIASMDHTEAVEQSKETVEQPVAI